MLWPSKSFLEAIELECKNKRRSQISFEYWCHLFSNVDVDGPVLVLFSDTFNIMTRIGAVAQTSLLVILSYTTTVQTLKTRVERLCVVGRNHGDNTFPPHSSNNQAKTHFSKSYSLQTQGNGGSLTLSYHAETVFPSAVFSPISLKKEPALPTPLYSQN